MNWQESGAQQDCNCSRFSFLLLELAPIADGQRCLGKSIAWSIGCCFFWGIHKTRARERQIAAGSLAVFKLPPANEDSTTRSKRTLKLQCRRFSNANLKHSLCFWSRFLQVMLSGYSLAFFCVCPLKAAGCEKPNLESAFTMNKPQ